MSPSFQSSTGRKRHLSSKRNIFEGSNQKLLGQIIEKSEGDDSEDSYIIENKNKILKYQNFDFSFNNNKKNKKNLIIVDPIMNA